jgi:hypothetical protein
MVKEQPKFLAVLPWLQLAEEIEVGPFTFWRWPEDAEKYVPNQAERNGIIRSVNKAFQEVKQSREDNLWKPVPVSAFSITSVQDKGHLVKGEEFESMRKAVDILCMCSLFATDIKRQALVSNTGKKDWYSNTFFYKNYTDFSFYIASLGKDPLHWRKNIRRRFGEELRLGQPEPILKPEECTRDKLKSNLPLLVSLSKLLLSTPSDFTRRIFRALAQFNSAYTDYPLSSILAEIVTLATAFEILLIPNYRGMDKCKELCLRFLAFFQNNDKINRIDNLRDGTEVEYPWKGWWLYWFYQLRNDIVHGEEIDPQRLLWLHNPHAGSQLEIAIGVFRLALMKTLAEEGFHTETEEDCYQSDKLDEWLSTEMESFPNGKDFDVAFWRLRKKNKAEGRA